MSVDYKSLANTIKSQYPQYRDMDDTNLVLKINQTKPNLLKKYLPTPVDLANDALLEDPLNTFSPEQKNIIMKSLNQNELDQVTTKKYYDNKYQIDHDDILLEERIKLEYPNIDPTNFNAVNKSNNVRNTDVFLEPPTPGDLNNFVSTSSEIEIDSANLEGYTLRDKDIVNIASQLIAEDMVNGIWNPQSNYLDAAVSLATNLDSNQEDMSAWAVDNMIKGKNTGPVNLDEEYSTISKIIDEDNIDIDERNSDIITTMSPFLGKPNLGKEVIKSIPELLDVTTQGFVEYAAILEVSVLNDTRNKIIASVDDYSKMSLEQLKIQFINRGYNVPEKNIKYNTGGAIGVNARSAMPTKFYLRDLRETLRDDDKTKGIRKYNEDLVDRLLKEKLLNTTNPFLKTSDGGINILDYSKTDIEDGPTLAKISNPFTKRNFNEKEIDLLLKKENGEYWFLNRYEELNKFGQELDFKYNEAKQVFNTEYPKDLLKRTFSADFGTLKEYHQAAEYIWTTIAFETPNIAAQIISVVVGTITSGAAGGVGSLAKVIGGKGLKKEIKKDIAKDLKKQFKKASHLKNGAKVGAAYMGTTAAGRHTSSMDNDTDEIMRNIFEPIIIGAVETISEKFELDVLLSPFAKKQMGKALFNYTKNIAKAMATGAGSEGLATIGQNITVAGFDKNRKWNEGVFEGFEESLAVGAFMDGGISAISQPFAMSREKVLNNPNGKNYNQFKEAINKLNKETESKLENKILFGHNGKSYIAVELDAKGKPINEITIEDYGTLAELDFIESLVTLQNDTNVNGESKSALLFEYDSAGQFNLNAEVFNVADLARTNIPKKPIRRTGSGTDTPTQTKFKTNRKNIYNKFKKNVGIKKLATRSDLLNPNASTAFVKLNAENINKIVKTFSNTKRGRVIGKIIKQIYNKFPTTLSQVNFGFDNSKSRMGGYFGQTNVITMSNQYSMSAETFLHELIHAVTMPTIMKQLTELGFTDLTFSNSTQYFNRLRQLSEKHSNTEIGQVAALMVKTIEAQGLDRFVTNLKTKAGARGGMKDIGGESSPYGLTLIVEFVTEAFANDAFQKELQSIKIPDTGKTVWSTFVDLIGRLIGYVTTAKGNNVLNETLLVTERLAKKTELESPFPADIDKTKQTLEQKSETKIEIEQETQAAKERIFTKSELELERKELESKDINDLVDIIRSDETLPVGERTLNNILNNNDTYYATSLILSSKYQDKLVDTKRSKIENLRYEDSPEFDAISDESERATGKTVAQRLMSLDKFRSDSTDLFIEKENISSEDISTEARKKIEQITNNRNFFLSLFTRSVNTRILNISAKVYRKVMSYYQTEQLTFQEYQRIHRQFIKEGRKVRSNLSYKDKQKFNVAILNGDWETCIKLGLNKETINNLTNVYARIANTLELEPNVNYYRRNVVDYDGLLELLERNPTPELERWFAQKKADTPQKKINAIKELLLSKTDQARTLQMRTIEKVTESMLPFYADPLSNQDLYFSRIARLQARAIVFGDKLNTQPKDETNGEKGINLEEDVPEQSIVEILEEVAEDDIFKGTDNFNELTKLVKSILNYKPGNKWFGRFRTATSFININQLDSILMQLIDIPITALYTGLRASVETITRPMNKMITETGELIKANLKAIGIDVLDFEYRDQQLTGDLTKNTSKSKTTEEFKRYITNFINGGFFLLKATDFTGKSFLLKSTQKQWARLAKKDPDKLKRILISKFKDAEFADKVVNDIKNNKASSDALLAYFMNVSEFHPITTGDNLKVLIDNPALRPVAVLMSFAFKMADRFGRQGITQLFDGTAKIKAGTMTNNNELVLQGQQQVTDGVIGTFRFIIATVALETLYRTKVREIRKALKILPEEETEEEEIINSFTFNYLWNIITINPFLNSFDLRKFVKDFNPEKYIGNQITPPFPGVKVFTDFVKAMSDEETSLGDVLSWDNPNLVKLIPFIGDDLSYKIQTEEEYRKRNVRPKGKRREEEIDRPNFLFTED